MKNKQIITLLFIFLAILPVLIFRDFTPDNELKYLSIADEAIENGHTFAFYNHGIPYADKPPLYFWVVMLGKILFGKHLMFFISLMSVIPALVVCIIMNKWTNQYYYQKRGTATDCSGNQDTFNSIAMLILATTAFFLACTIVLRMDMLMTMFIVLSLYTFYRMYIIVKQGSLGINPDRQCNYLFFTKYRRLQILLPIYIFLAIFSKGAVGFILPILVITIFLFLKGDIKDIGKYLGWRMWTVLASLCAIWFCAVYFDGGKDYLNNLLFNQTVNRAVNAFHHKKAFYYYGISFWYAAAPWSLLAIATLFIGYIKKYISEDLEKFYATVFFTTIVFLSLVSSKLEVYLLPCFPFLIYLAAILVQKLQKNIIIKICVAIPAFLLIASFIISLFISQDGDIMHISIPFAKIEENIPLKLYAPVQVFTSILFLGGSASLVFVFINKINKAIASFGITLLFVIFLASFSLPSLNKIIGAKEVCAKAFEIGKNCEINNFSIYGFKVGKNFDVYFKDLKANENESESQISAFELKEAETEELDSLSNVILLIETKDIAKDSLLRAAITDYKVYDYGKYSIVSVINDKKQ